MQAHSVPELPIAEPEPPSLQLLRRSLETGRLGHAYLFTGEDLDELENHALRFIRSILARQIEDGTLPRRVLDQVAQRQHPDITWVRPESKSRIISTDQTRELIRILNLRPTELDKKVAIVAAADRMNIQSANGFLKTLEEPPAGSLLILLTSEPERLLETILSRCLRLHFGSAPQHLRPEIESWVTEFAKLTQDSGESILARYRLLASLVDALAGLRETIREELRTRSPLERYPDAEPGQMERWNDELDAAVEAEYRRRRGEYLAGLHAWLRDIWMLTLGTVQTPLFFESLSAISQGMATRLDSRQAQQNLEAWDATRRLLYTNVQEALALEVGLLQLQFNSGSAKKRK